MEKRRVELSFWCGKLAALLPVASCTMPKMSFVKCKQLRININGSNAATKYIKQATTTAAATEAAAATS